MKSALSKVRCSVPAALLALAATALIACSSNGTGETDKEVVFQHPPVGANPDEQAGPDDLYGMPRPPLGRSVRRMPIDTLQAAMTKVAGNDVNGNPIEWQVNGKNGFSDAAFGKALGRPDFQAATDESSVSSALYLKFVGDAARDICFQMAKNDALRTDPKTRVLFPKAEVDGTATDAQKTENLQYVILRFLGLRVAATDPMVSALREVLDAGESAAVPDGAELTPSAEGWRGVCVTLFESPLFHND